MLFLCDQDDSGMTVEGLQEWYDEACLVVYNNKYNDGVQWHDVPCFTRWHFILYQIWEFQDTLYLHMFLDAIASLESAMSVTK